MKNVLVIRDMWSATERTVRAPAALEAAGMSAELRTTDLFRYEEATFGNFHNYKKKTFYQI